MFKIDKKVHRMNALNTKCALMGILEIERPDIVICAHWLGVKIAEPTLSQGRLKIDGK